LLAGGGTLVGTGAFTTVQADRTARVEVAGDADALLGLTPVEDTSESGDSNVPPPWSDDPPGESGDNVPGDFPGGGGPFGDSGGSSSDGNPYVDVVDGQIAITLDGGSGDADGLNRRAVTTFRTLVVVTNQGSNTVTELTLELVTSAVDPDETFRFPIDEVDGSGEDEVENGANALTGSDGIPDELGPGESIIFGIAVDLLRGGDENGSLPDDGAYTLRIAADAPV
jgi:hypothetical protein